jgi:hypothetical protein
MAVEARTTNFINRLQVNSLVCRQSRTFLGDWHWILSLTKNGPEVFLYVDLAGKKKP